MRSIVRIGLAVLAVWLGASPLAAQTVTEILDADTLRLQDGRELRLMGLRVARPPTAGPRRPKPCCASVRWTALSCWSRRNHRRTGAGGCWPR